MRRNRLPLFVGLVAATVMIGSGRLGAFGDRAPTAVQLDTVRLALPPDESTLEGRIRWRRGLSVAAGPLEWQDGPVLRTLSSADDKLVVVDPAEHKVAVVNAATGNIISLHGGIGQGLTQFFRPRFAVSSQASHFINDAGNRRLVVIAPTGMHRELVLRGQVQALGASEELTVAAIRASVRGTRVWRLNVDDSLISLHPMDIPTYPTVRSVAISRDGAIALVGAGSAIDVFTTQTRRAFVVTGSDPAAARRDSSGAAGSADIVTHVAAAPGATQRWWVLTGSSLLCIDTNSQIVLSRWRLSPTEERDPVTSLAPGLTGVFAYRAQSQEITHYSVQCETARPGGSSRDYS